MSDFQFHDESPRPLEVFTTKVIHPDNQTLLKERLDRFRPLPAAARFRLTVELRRLHGRLTKARYNQLCLARHQAHQNLLKVKADYLDLKTQLQFALSMDERDLDHLRMMRSELKALQTQGRQLCKAGQSLQRRIAELEPNAARYRQVWQRLEDHRYSVEHQHEQRENERQFRREAKWIEELLLNVFRNTTGCHYVTYDRKGRRVVRIPHFQKVGIDSDSHWFLLATSSRGLFRWRSLIPYGVNVQDLISETTLENMAAVTGRQVEVRRNITNTRIYFRVNRLDSPDGLPRKVPFRVMFDYYPEHKHNLLPWPVGVLPGRKAEWRTFADLPHVLIAGSSQSGKSNQVNCIISTIISMNKPAEARVVLIDNKGGVEFTHYGDIPHMLGKMVKNVDAVLPALQEVIRLMNARLAMLEESKVKDIAAYNSKAAEPLCWARVVVFIDELATILDQGQLTKDIHSALRLITSQGRAAGIHSVLCTQYSNVDVLPGSVKANLAVRMSGAMPSGSASMTVLDTYDAKNLPRIPGRMVIGIGSEMKEVQTAYISDADIAAAVEAAKAYGPAPDIMGELSGEGDTQEVITLPAWNEQRVIDYALSDFEGRLTAQGMHKALAEDSPGQRALQRIIDSILAMEYIESEGIEYEVKKIRRAYHLQPISEEAANAAIQHVSSV